MNRQLIISAIISFIFYGCASYKTQPANESPFLERVQQQQENNVRVKAAVPDASETQAIFGVDLYRRGIQPVWIEIENMDTKPVWFMPFGLDSMYFTPFEAALKSHYRYSKKHNSEMDRYFFKNSDDIYVHPGSTRKGFFFTSLDEGTKSFIIDLLGEDADVRSFTFFISVPGLKIDHSQVDFEALYTDDEWINFEDEKKFIEYVRNLPCCTMNKKGTDTGDPLNLILIGDGDDVHHSFIRAGWDETETITSSSAWRTGVSFIFGGRYRYSPVSAQYVFNRKQDAAFQKARTTIHERNHLRIWITPVTFKNKHVWVGQISRDIGVRFDKRTIVTHKIDPDVDETRNFLTQDLLYSQGLEKFSSVDGVGEATMNSPRVNLGKDPYFTDGFRGILWVSDNPVAFDEVKIIEWDMPGE